MPLLDAPQVGPALLNPLGATPLPDEETEKAGPAPGWNETLGAAFRTENIIGSFARRAYDSAGIGNQVEPGYNPWDDIKGTEYEEHWSNFVHSNNRGYTDFVKREIDKEEADRRTLAAAGARGTIGGLLAGVVDPTILIPVGGEIALAGKGAWRFGRGAVAGARAAGIGSAAQEAGLQATQELRTGEESAINIGSSVVLGSLVGGSIAALMSRPEQLAAESALETLGRHETYNAPEAVSAGAAAAQRISREDLTVSGRVAEKLASATRNVSPNLRANFRAAPSARQFSQELAENTLYQGMHDEGRSLGAAVETEMRSIFHARLFDAARAHRDIFSEMVKSEGIPFWSRGSARQSFEEAVGRAMRRGDVGENDFVSRAAKSWRERVVDPFKNEGIDVGLLPADVPVVGAESYFSRMYNKEKLTAKELEFKARVAGFYEQKIAADYAESVDAFQRLQKRFDEQEADFKLPPKKRAALVKELLEKGEALDTANAFHLDVLAEVNDLRKQAAAATKEGRFTDADVLKLEAREKFDAAGQPLKNYVRERRTLRQRHGRMADTPAMKASRDSRITKIAQKRAAAERLFYDRWEIKRLGKGVDPHAPDVRPNFTAHARDIADDVFDKLTGRATTSSASADPEYMTPLLRGPMKDRTFNVPDELIEDFLEDNVRSVMERYGRTMSADIALTKRFGRADMRDQISTIRDEYKALREAATTEADRAALAKDEAGAIRDLEAMRDLVRGTYKAQENASNYGRVVRALMAFNYLRVMGGVVIANIGEVMRPGMVHGMGRFMNEGVKPLLTNLDAFKLSVKEAQLGGQVTERVLQHRMMSLGEIGDPYRSGTAMERWLTNMTRTGSKWNGLVYWTDAMKSISSVLSQNRIIAGAISGKDARTLAYLGIDEDMAGRIAKQFTEHGETMDNVRVANTEKWTDDQAVRAYRSAVSKDVDSIIVTKSVGDVPLFANTPTGKMILQFRNYTFAAHQRLLLRGLQESQANFISGLIGMTALGMMGAVMRSWRGGEKRFEKFQEAATNPGYLVGEGLDLAGVFTLPVEVGNTTEKITQQAFGRGFNPVKTPLLAAGRLVSPEASMRGSSTRFANVGAAGAILGPTFGMVFDKAPNALGASKGLFGGEATESQSNAAQSFIPFNSYVGVREALQLANDDSPYVERH